METLNPDHRRWLLQMWTGLHNGEYWVIPRSETIFQKQGDRLVYLKGTEEEFQSVRSRFAHIGVEVVRA